MENGKVVSSVFFVNFYGLNNSLVSKSDFLKEKGLENP